MPNIYLKHPVHGAKVAISDLEVEYDEGNGWMRYNPFVRSDFEKAVPVNTFGLKHKYTRKSTETESTTKGI
jgi:hypothetical protein